MVVRLLARCAGRHRLRVLLCHDDALAKEARLCEVRIAEWTTVSFLLLLVTRTPVQAGRDESTPQFAFNVLSLCTSMIT